MKLSFKVKKRPIYNSSSDLWFHVKTSPQLPFKLQNKKSNSFRPIEFAIWVAFYPEKSRIYFNQSLINVFDYSWSSLVQKTQEQPSCSFLDLVETIDDYPWLRQEFSLWGNIFSSLWVSPAQNIEPMIYKTMPTYFKEWNLSKGWYCEDGVTPKAFHFSDLAFQERCILLLDENREYLEEELKQMPVSCLNVGPQFVGDSSTAFLLFDSWGFDDNGKLKYFKS